MDSRKDKDFNSSFSSTPLFPSISATTSNDIENPYVLSDFSISTPPPLLHHINNINHNSVTTTAAAPNFTLFSESFTCQQQQLIIPKTETYSDYPTLTELTHPFNFCPPTPTFNDSLFFTHPNPNVTDIYYPSQTLPSLFQQGSNDVSQNSNNRKQKNRETHGSSSRQRMSDKFRTLRKLMPWDKKIDTATMLAEAYNYIKFLQAQVIALQKMPPLLFYHDYSTTSTTSSNDFDLNSVTDNYCYPGSAFGCMGMLSRQQLLQVLLNTPEAQTRLYSQGCCIFSVEQLVIFKKKVAEKRAACFEPTLDHV